jgi:AraC family transcriptional regulator, regulatory protein of adaptative response / methylated-DNA-[protein]-cysteine methyltransferase
MDSHIGSSFIRCDSSRGTAELVVQNATYGPGGHGASIGYTIIDSELARILIAATASGVCWLGIHHSDAYLEAELRRDYPRAEIRPDNNALEYAARHFVAYLAKSSSELRLPVDIRATPFQYAVWRELCAIAPGTTRAYADIARRIGHPGAARAVGHANGANPLAIVIPCHRAVGSNGGLTGYRWGIEYKQRLLEHERTSAQTSLPLPTIAS